MGIQAVVGAAAGYMELPNPRETPPIDFVQDLAAPVLMIHGIPDGVVAVEEPQEFESISLELGKEHKARNFENAYHYLALVRDTKDEALRFVVDFYNKRLNR